jgi:hypothetical protein
VADISFYKAAWLNSLQAEGDKECVIMCDEKEIETTEEIEVLFSDDIEILEARLTDLIIAMGLPEEQSDAVLRLVSEILEDHHADILDTFEDTLLDDEDDEAEIVTD